MEGNNMDQMQNSQSIDNDKQNKPEGISMVQMGQKEEPEPVYQDPYATFSSQIPKIGEKLDIFYKPELGEKFDEDQSFPSFLNEICCPKFKFISTTVFLSLIQLIMYIITICFGIRSEPTELFAPYLSTLDKFGMIIPEKIRKGQILRWIAAVLYHANFIHLVYNIISQIMLGSFLEVINGQIKTIFLYLFSVISGAVFSSCLSGQPGVTSSSVIFSILGYFLAYTIINFSALDKIIGQANKISNLGFIFFVIILNVINAYNNVLNLQYANIGSFLFAFFFSMVLISPIAPRGSLFLTPTVWFWLGLSLSIVGFILECILFFTVVDA